MPDLADMIEWQAGVAVTAAKVAHALHGAACEAKGGHRPPCAAHLRLALRHLHALKAALEALPPAE